jgi:hypothetical protein
MLMVLVSASGCAMGSDLEPSETVGAQVEQGAPESLLETTVALHATFNGARHRWCGAVAIERFKLATVKHCLVEGQLPSYSLHGSADVRVVRSIAVHPTEDYAVLTTHEPLVNVPWVARSVTPHEPVQIVSPYYGFAYYTGEVESAVGNVVHLSSPGRKGDSGSPVYNADDQLVGILTHCDGDDDRCDPAGGSLMLKLADRDRR